MSAATPSSSGTTTPEGTTATALPAGRICRKCGRRCGCEGDAADDDDLNFAFKKRMRHLTHACRDVFLVLFVITVIYAVVQVASGGIPYVML